MSQKDETSAICIDASTLIELTKQLEQNLSALQANIKELKKLVKGACGKRQYEKE
jgi:hypothetical protein